MRVSIAERIMVQRCAQSKQDYLQVERCITKHNPVVVKFDGVQRRKIKE